MEKNEVHEVLTFQRSEMCWVCSECDTENQMTCVCCNVCGTKKTLDSVVLGCVGKRKNADNSTGDDYEVEEQTNEKKGLLAWIIVLICAILAIVAIIGWFFTVGASDKCEYIQKENPQQTFENVDVLTEGI